MGSALWRTRMRLELLTEGIGLCPAVRDERPALRCAVTVRRAGGGVKPASLWRVRVHQKFMSRPHDCI